MSKDKITITEAAKIMKCTRANIYWHIKQARIDAVHAYGKTLVLVNKKWQNFLESKQC